MNINITVQPIELVIEFAAQVNAAPPTSGGGDMTKVVYDGNDDGKVNASDNSDKLNSQTPAYYLDRDNHTGMQSQLTIQGSVTGQTLADDITTLYAEVASQLELGNTSVTAYRGDHGLVAYTHSQASGNPHGTAITDISGLATALASRAQIEVIPWPLVFYGMSGQPATLGQYALRIGNLMICSAATSDVNSNSTRYGCAAPWTGHAIGQQNEGGLTIKNGGNIITNGATARINSNDNKIIFRATYSGAETGFIATATAKAFYGRIIYFINTGSTKRVFFAGDSTMANSEVSGVSVQYGWGLSDAIYNLLTGNRPTAFNVATPGRTALQLLTDFSTQIQPFIRQNDVVWYQCGINDLRAGVSVATVVQRIKDLHAQARAAGAKTGCTAPIIGQLSGDAANVSADALAVTAALAADTSFCDAFVNMSLRPEFDNPADRLVIANFTDGLHHTAAAQGIIAAEVAARLQPLLTATPGYWIV
jgi:lysophospholipase L1-like esterase